MTDLLELQSQPETYEQAKEQTSIEFPPTRTDQARSLVKRRKKQEWQETQDIRSAISNRDILEFAAVRVLAQTLQDASDKLAELPASRTGYSRERAEEIFSDLISQPNNNLTPPTD